MNAKGDIVGITNAIKYFQMPLQTPLNTQLLQSHLNILGNMLGNSQQMQVGFLTDMLALVSKRFYEISGVGGQIAKEEYLGVRLVGVLSVMFKTVISKGGKLSKDQIIVLMSATLTSSKQVFQQSQKMTDLRGIFLQFNLTLLSNLATREDFKVEEIYPKQYSLCSNILKADKTSIRQFGLCLNTMDLLLKKNRYLREGDGEFVNECLKRLKVDVEHLSDVLYKYEIGFRNKVEPLCHTLLSLFSQKGQNKLDLSQLISQGQEESSQDIRKELFGKVVLLSQMCELSIDINQLNFYQKSTIEESYRQLYISSAKYLRKLDVNLDSKKRQFKKLNYLNSSIHLSTDENDQLFTVSVDLLQHIFSISKNHHLITIPFHATTIPLEKLTASHTADNYPNKGLKEEYERQFARVLAELMPFFELEPSIVGIVGKYIDSFTHENRDRLVQYFSDELLKYEYALNMSVTQLYSHIQLLCILKYIMSKHSHSDNSTFLNTIFTTLASKSESVKSLKASYIEEQLLIALSIELISDCYFAMKQQSQGADNMRSRIKQTQNSILLVEKVLNSIGQPSYIIRLSCTLSLFRFTCNQSLKDSLKALQTTIIARNKNNLELVLTLLELTSMSQLDYQELAQYYMNHRGAEPVLRYLLPKISTQLGRKCILTVQRWWLLLSKEVVTWLNCRQMSKTEDKNQNFAVEDGQNVVIKNALGVVIIELGERWVYYLRSQKREAIVDVLTELATVNPQMVFFKGNFTKIIRELHRIVLETLGKEEVEVTCSKSKSKNKIQEKKIVDSGMVDFYNRLRHKIYKMLFLIPSNNFALFDNHDFQPFKQLLLQIFQSCKRAYLFEGNSQYKVDYDLLKSLVATWQ